MTVFGLGEAALRSWYIVLLGCLATMVIAAHVAAAPGVYWAQVDVICLRPVSVAVPNSLTDTSDSVIATAGVIQRQVSGGPELAHVVSDGVTIVHEGIRSGETVRVPNAGGQWANNFNRAVLDVQVVDVTREKTQARLDSLLSKIDVALDQRQQASGVDPANRIRSRLSPAAVTIQYTDGEPRRGIAMTVVIGLALTIAMVVLCENMRARRKVRRPVGTSARTLTNSASLTTDGAQR